MLQRVLLVQLLLSIIFGVILGIVIPKKGYAGAVVFDIDNTTLCRGSMCGNQLCSKNQYTLNPENPCSESETIHASWQPQIFRAPNGFRQPVYDGRCQKGELGDGRDISCSIHKFNTGKLTDVTNCDSTIDPLTGFPKGIDCGAMNRAKKIIKMCRDKNYAIAINTAEFQVDALSKIVYLKAIGFTDDELKLIDDGGVITYNKSEGMDMYTQAKQKAINMISLAKKFDLPRHKVMLIDDMMANCKAVRDMGFKAYNVSTTYGQMYGWSADRVKNASNTPTPDKQCGITDSQMTKIFELL
jgi:hypothetical protein